MKTDTIQTRKWITTCLMALLTFCLVLTGIFFIAPIKAEAYEVNLGNSNNWWEQVIYDGSEDSTTINIVRDEINVIENAKF